ncbi:glycosyl hydrolase 115 family protein [Parabacteroides sp. FAFU027]|uniref:glycosyl hydrolase 115 family protein n=1 Tax=Parabacteroides sp. FAFU027 TaxID=2922715 RepID=UPI001FAEF39D|nr:glycosyl hydrolase 115 family protein [Parabacteroides sp. FAFU027]
MSVKSNLKHLFLIAGIILIKSVSVNASDKVNFRTPSQFIQHIASSKSFKIVANGAAAQIVVDPADWKGVIRAANDLGDDVRKVSGVAASVKQAVTPDPGSIIIGTIGKSRVIDKLIADKKIDVSDIKGQWESFLIQTVDGNLVVAGSDKRGTIYGVYDISEKIGVSPWYFWADVPAKRSSALYVKAGRYVQDSPKVKYRGIFINDESPSFTGWCNAKFGGVNSKMYVNMFELLLRLKANYLWPAMWGNAFNEDDPMSPVLADEYGIVMGTSHHEPMMRAQKEYTKRKEEIGTWDFVTNSANLEKFWFDGLNRNKNYENLITMSMRGDGDVAMGKGNDLENIKTLQNVIKSQRDIIQKVYNDDPANHPQLWAIFTEVQRYYDAGFNVPEDITLLFCDNNWGYIRRILPPKEKNRKGGAGLYYHIDMNGGPNNDRWVNTTTIPKLREQFNLAYQSGLDRIWIVNVGDLKPKELPIDFIMHFAWNPDAYPADKASDYTINWAKGIFGEEHAEEIADIVSKYSKYNLLRKAEVQSPQIFSYVNYNEADRMLKLWRDVVAKAEALEAKIAPEAKDAYYQLVLYPTKASAGVAEMYISVGKNLLYAKQGRVNANDYAQRTRDLFDLDKKLSDYYNVAMSNGKWKNMMSDIHIGYTSWQMPRENKLPEMKVVTPLAEPTLGVAVEGSEAAWPGGAGKPQLPVFDRLKNQSYYIDVFNRGVGSFQFEAKANKSWIKLNKTKGKVEKDVRLIVDVDWKTLPEGKSDGIVEIRKGNELVSVTVSAIKAALPKVTEPYFGNFTGEFTIPAEKFNVSTPGKNAKWILLPDLGKGKACMGIYPVTSPSTTAADGPKLEYKVFLPTTGKTTVCLGILPTQDVYPQRGLRIAVALDGQEPLVLDARKGFYDEFKEYTPEILARSTVLKPYPPLNKNIALIGAGQFRRNEIFDNMRWLDFDVNVKEPGIHTLKIIMIDPEVVVEKIVVNPDNNHPSYFGAPSIQHNAR